VELRRYARAKLEVPVEFSPKGQKDRVPGLSRDISLGGMFIDTSGPLPFGAELTVYVTLPGQNVPFSLPGVVRWTRPDGMGVQFGLLGARETHAITEVTKEGSPA
jgi:type IV pilus assembly protein PilZ